MKLAFLFSAVFLVLFMRTQPDLARNQNAARAKDSIRTVRMYVPGLKTSQSTLLQTVIQRTPGVLGVHFLAKKQVLVKFDIQKTNLKNLDDSLRRAGYRASFY